MISWNEIDELLLREFKEKKENKIFQTIGYKIELVNKLYNCNLKMDKRVVATEIKNLNLDSMFTEKEWTPEKIVAQIATIHPVPYRRSVGLVFSSKYCHFHYPDMFPIYDKFSRYALSDLLEKKKSEYTNKYSLFKRDLDDLMAKLSWKTSYNDLDKYLWLYGQWVEYKKYEDNQDKLKKKFSRRMRNFIKENYTLFQQLTPE